MCATLRPPAPSCSLYHSPLLFSFCSATHSVSASVEQQQQATCSVEILSTDAADFFHHLSLSPSFFLSFDSWPTSFRRKKAESKQKIDEIRKCCCCSRSYAFATFFSFLFFLLLRFVVVVVGFAQLQNIFWSLTFSFAHFFRCLPACCCCFFCVLFVFHFLKFRLLLFFLLPPPPFYYIVSVFRVNLQVTPSDL